MSKPRDSLTTTAPRARPTPRAGAAAPTRPAPAAPPPYRPQPTPRVLQTKSALPASPRPALAAVKSPAPKAVAAAARPPFRPQPTTTPRAVQTKQPAGAPPRTTHAPPAAAPRGAVIQRIPLVYSPAFATEKQTYANDAKDYYEAEVVAWLKQAVKKGGQIVGEEATKVLGKLNRSPVGANDWDRLGHYIDWVNRAHGVNPKAEEKEGPEHMLGVPPSKQSQIGLKYADFDDYVAKKTAKQAARTPVSVEHVAEKIKNANGGPSDVGVTVIINGATKNAPKDNRFVNDLTKPYLPHNKEIHDSRGDGEVATLSNALGLLVKDLGDRRSAHRHEVAIVGPHGACDGCKDRIKMFKQLWRQQREQIGAVGATLLITYFYRNDAAKGVDRPASQYGWREAQAANHAVAKSYFYWSTDA